MVQGVDEPEPSQVLQRSRRELRGPVLVQDPLGPAAAGCVVADQDADVGDEHRNR